MSCDESAKMIILVYSTNVLSEETKNLRFIDEGATNNMVTVKKSINSFALFDTEQGLKPSCFYCLLQPCLTSAFTVCAVF